MQLRILETGPEHLEELLALWNDGDVMNYVGYPEGLGYDLGKMEEWLLRLGAKKETKHFCLYDGDQFLGETFYSVVERVALLDIKLKKEARGKNVAFIALSFTMDEAFRDTSALKAIVDPSERNERAIHLYERIGFKKVKTKTYKDDTHIVMEILRQPYLDKRRASVRLDEVTKENFIAVCKLQVRDQQKHFVAPNSFSLAQSKYQPECLPFAIYVESNLVGFLMIVPEDTTDHLPWIYRLMIDRRFQGLGYGKLAMKLALDLLREKRPGQTIKISFEPENAVAQNLYEGLGFVSTGVIDGGEIVYTLSPKKNN